MCCHDDSTAKKETFARTVVVGRAVRLLRSNEMLTMMMIAASSLTLPTWTTSTTTAPKVSGHATAVDLSTGNVLVFAGLTGSAGSPCTNDLWSYDGAAWQKLDTIGEGPGPRMYSAAATLGQNLYVFGGWDPEAPGSGGTFKDDVWKLHLPTLTWTQLDPMPCGPVSRHVACPVGAHVVVPETASSTGHEPAPPGHSSQPQKLSPSYSSNTLYTKG